MAFLGQHVGFADTDETYTLVINSQHGHTRICRRAMTRRAAFRYRNTLRRILRKIANAASVSPH